MIAIIAKNGMLGSEVVTFCNDNNIDYVAFSKLELDITNKTSLEKLTKYKVSAIINCSAYTNVDLAESQKSQANEINANGVQNLAEYAKKYNVKLVHISTDYVFKGDGNVPYRETDICQPQTTYGKTKLKGEYAIQASGCDYLIIRTSWLFGHHGKNFIETMISLNSRTEVNVVADQLGSPTSCEDLTMAMFSLLTKEKSGIYHISNRGICSWYQFAQLIFKEIDANTIVNPCTSEEFPTVAKRPKYSVMDTRKLSDVYKMPSWETAVKKYIKER